MGKGEYRHDFLRGSDAEAFNSGSRTSIAALSVSDALECEEAEHKIEQ